jgi:alpha-beta hydrolase superfamily lysophospholipase
VVHGLGEHIGRYVALTKALVHAGYSVTGYDQRGHGRSGGPRGGVSRPDDLLVDLATIIDHARERLVGRRCSLILLGHSMGGTVVGRFVAEGLAERPAPWYRRVDAMVVSSPAWAADLSLIQRFLMQVGRLIPDLAASNGLDPTAISRDAEVVRAYRSDPLVHDRITPRLARFILDAGLEVRAAAPRWTTPSLVMWAGTDRCVAARGSAEFVRAAPSSIVQAQCFERLSHEIFNEPEREQVLTQLLAWLDRNCPSRQ